jgi:hypothetical protein
MEFTKAIYLDMEDFAINLMPIPVHGDTYVVAGIKNNHRPITFVARAQRVHINSVIYRLQALFSVGPEELESIRKRLENGEVVFTFLRTSVHQLQQAGFLGFQTI